MKDNIKPQLILPNAIRKIEYDDLSRIPEDGNAWVSDTRGLGTNNEGLFGERFETGMCTNFIQQTAYSRLNVTNYYISDTDGYGRECAGYLYFIIRNYHSLPEWMEFLHGPTRRKSQLVRK